MCWSRILFIYLVVLLAFQGKKDLVAVDNDEFPGEMDDVKDSDDEENREERPKDSSSDIDSDVERRRSVKRFQ